MRRSILALVVFALLTVGPSVSADPALEFGVSVWDIVTSAVEALEAIFDGVAEYLGGDGPAPEGQANEDDGGGLPDMGPTVDPVNSP